MNNALKIALAEPSAIIRTGLVSILKHLPGFHFQLIEIASTEQLPDALRTNKPDILIVNPVIPGSFSLETIKEESGCKEMKCIALIYQSFDLSLLRQYDEQISIFDSADELRHKIERLDHTSVRKEQEGTEDQQLLSAREKDIVIGVVKRMTNREIADSLFISTHTVITHRRNIARKLQIHSASGLTIYAIVNKLVELSDIQQ
jgi:DNA-binding NarL/FixJ family response regulator